MKTLVIREGDYLTIRAIATENDLGRRDRCETHGFFEEQSTLRSADWGKLLVLLKRTSDFGPPNDDEKFKKLEGTDGICEFRAGRLRLFCFWDAGNLIVGTHGLVKSTQKTPKRELKHAEQKRREYFEAKNNGKLANAPGTRK
jgi:phage-related protein